MNTWIQAFLKRNRRGREGLLGSRGEFTTGCAVMIVLFLAAGFVSYKFIIPHYTLSSLESRISEMMPYYRNHDAQYVQRGVIEIARDFDIELLPEQVKVQVLKKENRLIVDIEYQEDVELPFYVHTLTFRPHLTGAVY